MNNPQSILKGFLKMLEWTVYKVTSGRFLLSIMAGVGLLMMESAILDVLKVKAAEEGGISATEILAFASTIFVVIQSVFMSYFNIRRHNEKWEDSDHPEDESRPNPPVNKE